MAQRTIGIIGGGILGLALGRHLAQEQGATVTVLEKEDRIGSHQTGRNSGVVHAGIYYPPGSLKAQLCRRGVGLLREYCQEYAIAYREVGKLVVALSPADLPRLATIRERAVANGVPGITELDAAGLREIEPASAGIAAVHSPTTAITDFVGVCDRLAQDVVKAGGEVHLAHRVTSLSQHGDHVSVAVRTPTGPRAFTFDAVVACAGLGTDAAAAMAGLAPEPRIVPFRGEYYRLAPGARDLVRGLIYPVPDPRYPFLGVHLTRTWDDEVLVGPNAVLALALEGYTWRDVDVRATASLLAWPGMRSFAKQHWRTGVGEYRGSLSTRAFLAKAQAFVPALTRGDLLRARAGVRAQAIGADGGLVDDFVIDTSGRVVVVRNAPSPAATSSLAIAEYLGTRVAERFAGTGG